MLDTGGVLAESSHAPQELVPLRTTHRSPGSLQVMGAMTDVPGLRAAQCGIPVRTSFPGGDMFTTNNIT